MTTTYNIIHIIKFIFNQIIKELLSSVVWKLFRILPVFKKAPLLFTVVQTTYNPLFLCYYLTDHNLISCQFPFSSFSEISFWYYIHKIESQNIFLSHNSKKLYFNKQVYLLQEELDRLPRNLKILALHRKKVIRAEHEKKKDLVKSWISEQNFKDRFVKNPKTSKNDQDCSNKVKGKNW